MKACVFCGKERDLFSLELKHCEEEYGGVVKNKVCGNCWDSIFAIALHAVDSRIESMKNKYKMPSTQEMRKQKNKKIAAILFEAIMDSKSNSENVSISLDGYPYLYMSQIRNQANSVLSVLGFHLSPQAVGRLIRNQMEMRVGKRHGKGIPVYLDQEIIQKLSDQFDLSNNAEN